MSHKITPCNKAYQLRKDLANITNLCSMLVRVRASPVEVVEAFAVRDGVISRLKSVK